MRLGILGLPNSGKTTLFNALTGGSYETSAVSSGQFHVNTAVVSVPDERLDVLEKMYTAKKKVHATITYTDIGGLSSQIEQISAEVEASIEAKSDQLEALIESRFGDEFEARIDATTAQPGVRLRRGIGHRSWSPDGAGICAADAYAAAFQASRQFDGEKNVGKLGAAIDTKRRIGVFAL